MERLLAWYQVGSSYAAVAALLISNTIPLFGVLFLGWNVWTILTIYWLENGVVGFFNVLKMARAEGPDLGGGLSMRMNGRPVGGAANVVLIPFFVLQYGVFWLVHGIFILTLPTFAAFGGGQFETGGFGSGFDGAFGGFGGFGGGISGGDVGSAVTPVAPAISSDPLAILLVVVGLFISHGVSYRLNYIGRGEYLRTSTARQMAAPYGRLVVLHVTIIIGAMAIAFTGAPAAVVLVLVVLKIALDLGLHLAAHREPSTQGSPASATGDGAT